MISVFSRFIGKGLLAALGILFLSGGTSWAGWHQLTQADRDWRIVTQAMTWLKNPPIYGGNCKNWARAVVQGASSAAGGPVVGLPSTIPNADGYDWATNDPQNPVIPYGALSPNAFESGMIVQMRTRMSGGGYTPHTFIIVSNWPSLAQFTVIESNYPNGNLVRTRVINYGDFPGTSGTPMIEPVYHYRVFKIP